MYSFAAHHPSQKFQYIVSCLNVRLGKPKSNKSYPEESRSSGEYDVFLSWLTAETRIECRVIVAVHVDMSIDIGGFLISDSRDKPDRIILSRSQ